MRFLWMVLSAALLLGIAGFVGADFTMLGSDPGNSGICAKAVEMPVALAWEFPTKQTEDNPCPVLVSDGKAVICVRDVIYCLDEESGQELWRYPSSGVMRSVVRTSPAVAEGMVYVPMLSGELAAFSLQDGSQGWSFDAKKPIRNAITYADGVIYFGTSGNLLYAIDAKTGTAKWSEPFKAGEDIMSRPILTRDFVIICSRDLFAYGVDIKTGKQMWSQRIPSTKLLSPTLFGDVVLVPSDKQIMALTASSGMLRWQVDTTGTVTSNVAVDQKRMYFGTKEGQLVCLDVRGKLVWSADTDGSIDGQPAIANGVVYVTNSKGTILGYGVEKGELKWRFQTPPYDTGQGKWGNQTFTAPISISDKSAFVVTNRGTVYRFQREVPDRGVPTIGNLRPLEGKEIAGRPPVTFTAYIRDDGSGINPATVVMYVDSDKVKSEFDPMTGKVSYETPVTQPVVPLADGAHSVRIVACDWWGNKAETTWDFKVNNRLAGGGR